MKRWLTWTNIILIVVVALAAVSYPLGNWLKERNAPKYPDGDRVARPRGDGCQLDRHRQAGPHGVGRRLHFGADPGRLCRFQH